MLIAPFDKTETVQCMKESLKRLVQETYKNSCVYVCHYPYDSIILHLRIVFVGSTAGVKGSS